MELRTAIAHAVAHRSFTADQMAELVGLIMSGEGHATAAQIAALLVALRMKGETVDEVVGAARAMRARATPLRVPGGVVIDTCGTGGDASGSLNVSTLAALVVAACGVRVAKHGNRAQSSRSGSADLLESLGVNLAATVPQVERCVAEVGLGFLFAPAFHGATRHAAGVRREIGVRTLFNLLGPLTNPAGVRHQVVGVYDAGLLQPVCQALGDLGAAHVLVVHGAHQTRDGRTLALDEVSPTGPTQVAEWRGGQVRRYEVTPRDFGLPSEDVADWDGGGLDGGDPAENAARARALLAGDERPLGSGARAVVMAAACGLYVAGAGDLIEGARRAEAALRAGQGWSVLEALRRVSHAPPESR